MEQGEDMKFPLVSPALGVGITEEAKVFLFSNIISLPVEEFSSFSSSHPVSSQRMDWLAGRARNNYGNILLYI